VLRAVLDANVFVSAAIRPEGPPGQLLRLFLRDEAFPLVVSPAIATEIAHALAYPAVRKCMRAPIDTNRWLDSILLLADLVTDSTVSVKAGSGIFGDPAPMQYKQLRVDYKFDGVAKSKTGGEDQPLTLP